MTVGPPATLRIELRRVRLDRARGAGNAHRRWAKREHLLLRLVDEASGTAGFGEVSPLPGYSPDVLRDATTALAQTDVASLVDGTAPALAALPALRCGLETARFDLDLRRRHLAAREAMGARWSVAVAGLMTDLDGAPEEAARLVAEGFRTLKLKVGAAGRLDAELAAVAAVRRRVGPDVVVRLDANRGWSEALAVDALRRAADLGVTLVEEPCPEPWRLRNVPPIVGLDESLQGLAILADRLSPCVAAVVLKPMVLGYDRAHALGLEALGAELTVIASHTFDGPLALAQTRLLAATVGSEAVAHGVGRHGVIDAWHAAAPSTPPGDAGPRVPVPGAAGLGDGPAVWAAATELSP